MNAIVFDYGAKTYSVSSSFLKKARIFGTAEYYQLQEVAIAHPDFKQLSREFKKNSKQEHYNGLTYNYMRTFIKKYETKDTVQNVLSEFDKQLDLSRCHSAGKRYPIIRKWFLDRYPDIYSFGKTEEEIALDVERAKAKKAEAALKTHSAAIEAHKLETLISAFEEDAKVLSFRPAINQ